MANFWLKEERALILFIAVLIAMSFFVAGCTNGQNEAVPDEEVGDPVDKEEDECGDDEVADDDEFNTVDKTNKLEEVVVPFNHDCANISEHSYVDPETMVYYNRIYDYSYDMPDSWKGKVEVVEKIFEDKMYTFFYMLSESEPRRQYLLVISVLPPDADVLEEDVLCRTESHIYSLTSQIAIELSKQENIDLFDSLNSVTLSWQEKAERFRLNE